MRDKRIIRTPDEMRDWFRERMEPEPNTGCMFWLGSIGNGYGLVRYWDGDTLRRVKAHRLSYELFVGPIPSGEQVLHRCDTPECVNWDHFFLGTNTDNVADRVRKGRQRNRPFVQREPATASRRTRPEVCIAGHPWTTESTYVTPAGMRTCRVCKLRRQNEYQERKRAQLTTTPGP